MVEKKQASQKSKKIATPKKATTPKKTEKAKMKKVEEQELENEKRYFEAVGRRKRAVARVRLFTSRPFEGDKGKVKVNQKDYYDFFPTLHLRETMIAPLKKMNSLNRFEATVLVRGGGVNSQAEAIRHGLARALVKFNPDFSKKLKRAGFLRRDAREKERKKPGLKKARRAPQWKKR